MKKRRRRRIDGRTLSVQWENIQNSIQLTKPPTLHFGIVSARYLLPHRFDGPSKSEHKRAYSFHFGSLCAQFLLRMKKKELLKCAKPPHCHVCACHVCLCACAHCVYMYKIIKIYTEWNSTNNTIYVLVVYAFRRLHVSKTEQNCQDTIPMRGRVRGRGRGSEREKNAYTHTLQ